MYTFIGARRELARATTERTRVSKISPHFWKKVRHFTAYEEQCSKCFSSTVGFRFPVSICPSWRARSNKPWLYSQPTLCLDSFLFFFLCTWRFCYWLVVLLSAVSSSCPFSLLLVLFDFIPSCNFLRHRLLAVSRQIVLFRLSSWSETTGRCHVLNSLALSSSLLARIVLFSSSSPSSGFSSFIPHRPSTRCGQSGELSIYNPIAIGVEMRLGWTKTNRSWLWQQSPQSVRVCSVCYFCKRNESLKTFSWWIWTFTTRLFFPSLWSKRPLSSWATDYWWWRLSDTELCSTLWTVTSVPCASPDSSPELSFHSVSATMSGKRKINRNICYYCL